MVTVFSQKFCPKCEELKELLKDSNIAYEEKDVGVDFTAYAKLLFNDIEETPAVQVGEEFLSGDVADMYSKIRATQND